MLTKTQLKSQEKKGYLDQVYSECRRYGVVNHQSDYTEKETVNFKTGEQMEREIRAVYITYKDLYWSFKLCLGEVFSSGWSTAPKAPHENFKKLK